MDSLRSQLAEQIRMAPAADLKAILLSWVESRQSDREIKALQQAFGNNDGWDKIDALVGTVDAPADWALEHDHYLYNTSKQAPVHD